MRIAIAGGFDPIHAGHISHIVEARKLVGQGGTLYVILARDDQLVKKKGRTFYKNYSEREAIISNIKGVKIVVKNIDEDTTCAKTLAFIKPDVFAKGGDRTPDNMPKAEIDTCNELGIRIVYGVGRLLNSSTELTRKMNRKDYW